MEDLTAAGTRITLVASKTLPQGLDLTSLPDDTDPISFESVVVAEMVLGANGTPISWSKPNPTSMTIALIPGSDDDRTLAALLNVNKIGQGKVPAYDVITITLVTPSGNVFTCREGKLLEGPGGPSWKSDGRFGTHEYKFAFADVVPS